MTSLSFEGRSVGFIVTTYLKGFVKCVISNSEKRVGSDTRKNFVTSFTNAPLMPLPVLQQPLGQHQP